MAEYPEHDKLHAIQEESQAIGNFLDNGPYTLCVYDDFQRRFRPVDKSIQQVLADWYDIDLNRLEEEKQAMLEAMREANA